MAEKKTTTKKIVKKTTAKKAVPKKPSKKKVVVKKTVTKKSMVKKVATKRKVPSKLSKPYSGNSGQRAFARKSAEMGLFSRFYKIFTPTFLSQLGEQKSSGKSWGFWFLSNFLLVLIPTIAFFIFQASFFTNFPDKFVEKIPDNAEFKLENGEAYSFKEMIRSFEFTLTSDGKLSSKNIPDPVIFSVISGDGEDEDEKVEFHTSLEEIDDSLANFVFVLDTKETFDVYNSEKTFNNFIYILANEAIVYDGKKNQTQIVDYKEIIAEEDISSFPKVFNYEILKQAKPAVAAIVTMVFVSMMFIVFFFLAIVRLLNAVIWALIFWAIGSISGVRDWDFEKAFMGMLHFSFISIVFVSLAFVLNISAWLYAFIVFGLLFGMNFWEMKKK